MRIAIVVALAAAVAAACTGDDGGRADSEGNTAKETTTSVPAATSPTPILFSPEGNNLNAFSTAAPFEMQRVNTANHGFNDAESDPDGWDVNGQVCVFDADGTTYLVAGEDTGQPEIPAGWGVFVLTGSGIGDLRIDRVSRLVPTFQPTEDGPDTYGCGVLSDGRILTTDIGNTALGAANGQLSMFYGPYDPDPSRDDEKLPFCKLDNKVATGQAIAVTPDDHVFLNSPRPSDDPDATAGGVFEYPGPFPTAPEAAGGCGRTDDLGSPMADSITKQRVLSAGANDLGSPSGLAYAPNGHWFVASVINGVINEYDERWNFLRTVLRPPPGEELGEQSFTTGTPLGIAVDPDGNLFYADIGIVLRPGRTPGPGTRTGSIQRISFAADGTPSPPEVLAENLQFPDGLGIWNPGRPAVRPQYASSSPGRGQGVA
jgi:hypothetical protein